MSSLIVFLDIGGVINDKRQQTAEFQRQVGDYFAPLLGGTAEAWNEAHRVIATRLLEQEEALAQAAPDFISFHRTYNHKWLGAMCELLGFPILPQEECIALADHAIASIASHVRAALPGAIEAIRLLHRQGYRLHTASGTFSFELEGYMKGIGVQRCFGRLYGADLINTFKNGPEYYEHIFADLGIGPTEALVVDDSFDAIGWAAQTGARTALVNTSSHPVPGMTPRIGSLAELPAFLSGT